MRSRVRTVVSLSKEDVIANLREKAERDQTRKISCFSIEKDPKCYDLRAIRKVYPDPNEAIREAGLFPAKPNREDLIRSLLLFREETGREPIASDATGGRLIYSATAYNTAFGLWSKAKEAAGFAKYERGARATKIEPGLEISRAEIIENLREKAERDKTLRLSLTNIEKDFRCYRLWEIRTVYPDPNEAIREAGLFPAKPNRDDLIRSLLLFREETGREPKLEDVTAGNLIYSVSAYLREFILWNEAKKAAGFSVHEPRRRFRKAGEREEFVRKLLASVIKVYGATGVLPSMAEYDRNSPEYPSHVLIYHIGSWRQVAKRTNLCHRLAAV